MTKDNLTKQQLSTLFLVNTINELVDNNSNEEIGSVGDVYFSLFHADRKDTLQLLKEILELEELGYVRTSYTAEDLEDVDTLPLLIDDEFKIKILIDISAIKQELQVSDEEVEKIVEEVWENDEIQKVCTEDNGKETLADYIKEFIDSETTQKGADLISKVGIKTFLMSLAIPVCKYMYSKFKERKNV